MPRYYFHLTDGKDKLEDREGIELADAAAARQLADAAVARLLERLKPVFWITDHFGALIDALPLDGSALTRGQAAANASLHGSEQRLRQWQDWFGAIEEIVSAGYYEVELRSRALHCSAGFKRVMGFADTDEVSLSGLLGRLPKAARGHLRDAITSTRIDDIPFDVELPTLNIDRGAPLVRVFGLRDRKRGDGDWIAGVCADISQERKLEAMVWHAAHHDALTGLPNRAHFEERLPAILADAKAKGTKVGVLLVDLDHLKDINGQLGNESGDDALRSVAETLSRAASGAAWAARVGEDEFAMILPDLHRASDAEQIANRLRERVAETESSRRTGCAITVGTAVFPDHGRRAADLLQDAELALIRAKSSRHQRVMPFLREMRQTSQRRLSVLELVRQALNEDRVFPYYQPKVSLITGRTVGFEALLRWRHPSKGTQLPGTIIEAFDDRDLSEALRERMLDRVLSDVIGWGDATVKVGRIAINASPVELREGAYAADVLRRLDRAGLTPEMIEIEVTESAFVGEDTARVARELERLSQAGVSIALDDFGTGYGSLIHLRQFPVDVVKIDRSFTMDIGPSPNSSLIVHAIISLATSLGIEVVAEGVEDRAQAKFLRDEGCPIAQGFLFSRALPAVDVPAAAVRTWWDTAL